MELQFQVSQIPERDGLVSRAGGQDELRVGIEGQTIDLGRVGINSVRGLKNNETIDKLFNILQVSILAMKI